MPTGLVGDGGRRSRRADDRNLALLAGGLQLLFLRFVGLVGFLVGLLLRRRYARRSHALLPEPAPFEPWLDGVRSDVLPFFVVSTCDSGIVVFLVGVRSEVPFPAVLLALSVDDGEAARAEPNSAIDAANGSMLNSLFMDFLLRVVYV